MIFHSVVEALRRQNWTAIAIELVIVVTGVFVGTQVSNWNQARVEKAATSRMLVQFAPELQAQIGFFDSARTYYASSRRYADEALAAWAGDRRISDERFVIAAYQASQIYAQGLNAENWTLTFGGGQVRNIEDAQLRRNLELVLTQDYGQVQFAAVATPYREQVRRVIPIHLQDLIRRECGDRQIRNTLFAELPATCSLRLPPHEAKSTAAALRTNAELPRELNWHLAAVAQYQESMAALERPIRALHRDLSRLSKSEVGRTPTSRNSPST
jgi:hypothetical protein